MTEETTNSSEVETSETAEDANLAHAIAQVAVLVVVTVGGVAIVRKVRNRFRKDDVTVSHPEAINATSTEV